MAKLRGHSGLTDRGLVRGVSAPSGAAIGQMWFNTGTGVLYQRTANVDGSSFWLDISSGGIGTSANRGVDFVGDTDPHKATNGTGLAVGSVYYNREKNRHFVCTDATSGANVWSGRFAAAGGTVTDYESGGTFYKVHTFLDSSTFQVEDASSCDIFILGGGGAGGHGGGGAGAFRAWTGMSFPAGNYTMTIGAGGGHVGTGSLMGGNTTVVQASGTGFSTITAQGGGNGGSTAGNGGSGGGGKAQGNGGPTGAGTGNTGGNTAAINSGTVVTPAVSGYAGGAGIGSDHLGSGGGGGASAVGGAGLSGTATGASGPGGDGGGSRNNNFRTGSNIAYAGGGGGTGKTVGGGASDGGDSGGGGATAGDYGGPASGQPADATPNSGSGGGGGDAEGGYGGSGIIVIRYTLS